jgi:hypothetical protein
MIRRAVLVAVPVAVALATPALSQGILEALFGFRSEPPPHFYAPAQRVSPYIRNEYVPRRREVRRPEPIPQPKYARLPREQAKSPVQADSPIPLKPKPMGEVENPVPKLLTDSTLRDGDIVVFPDGPRVFKGSPGHKHHLKDFVAITQRSVGPSTRKLLAAMKIGPNDAWSTDITAPSKRIATRDVETTGSLAKRKRP